MKTGIFFSFLLVMCLVFFTLNLQGCQNKTGEQKTSSEKSEPPKADKKTAEKSYIFGKVKETMDSGGYTYMLLEFEGNDFWVAVPEMKVAVGEEVMLLPGDIMKNFHSNKLNRTFETIIFSQGPVSPKAMKAHSGSKLTKKPHSGTPMLPKEDIKVEKASGEGAITIEMAYQKAKELDGKTVLLKAQVIKVSKNILGKNWLHVQDGTGKKENKDYDLTVTTKASPAVGQLVMIRGVLHTDRDIGAGYFYPIIIEDANVTVLK